MVFCRCCGKQLHESAPMCPHCGGLQRATSTSAYPAEDGPLWASIISVVLGIICLLAFFDQSEWDRDTKISLLTFSLAGIVVGVMSIINQVSGRKLAIAGVTLSSIALLCSIGVIFK